MFLLSPEPVMFLLLLYLSDISYLHFHCHLLKSSCPGSSQSYNPNPIPKLMLSALPIPSFRGPPKVFFQKTDMPYIPTIPIHLQPYPFILIQDDI